MSETCTHGSRKFAQIAGLRPIALERIAAATDPLALEQVDLAFLVSMPYRTPAAGAAGAERTSKENPGALRKTIPTNALSAPLHK